MILKSISWEHLALLLQFLMRNDTKGKALSRNLGIYFD